jgi:hypothetical protein
MAFDPLTWFIGASLTETGKRLLARIEASQLNDHLRKAISDWCTTLPPDLAPSPTAFFPPIATSEGPAHTRPALMLVRSRFDESHVPAANEWLGALVEHWQCRCDELGKDAHPFFLQDPGAAKAQLDELALRLENVCKQDDTLFRATTLDLLRDMAETRGPTSTVLAVDLGLGPDERSLATHDRMAVTYALARDGGRVRIDARLGYLDTLAAGGPIEPINCVRPAFTWNFPKLAFKVVNNTSSTIYATEVILDVEKSCVDPRPVIVVREDTQGRFPFTLCLLNEGGVADEVMLRFRLKPLENDETDPTWDGDYPWQLSLGQLGEQGARIDLSDFFVQAGADIALIRRLEESETQDNGIAIPSESGEGTTVMSEVDWKALSQQAVGPFKERHGLVIGELVYRWKSVTAMSPTTQSSSLHRSSCPGRIALVFPGRRHMSTTRVLRPKPRRIRGLSRSPTRSSRAKLITFRSSLVSRSHLDTGFERSCGIWEEARPASSCLGNHRRSNCLVLRCDGASSVRYQPWLNASQLRRRLLRL